MSRRIVTTQLQAGAPSAPIDTYFDRVVKYIPSDVVAAWVTVTGLVQGAADVPARELLWIAFAAGLVLTAAWTLKQTAAADKPPALTQTSIATMAFAVWVFAVGGPFTTLDFYRPLYGSLLLLLYTLVAGLITPGES